MPGAPSPNQRRGGIPYAPTNSYQSSHQSPYGQSHHSSAHDHRNTHLSSMMSNNSHLSSNDPSLSMLRPQIQPTSPIPTILGSNSLLGNTSLLMRNQGTNNHANNDNNNTSHSLPLPLSNPLLYSTPPQLPEHDHPDLAEFSPFDINHGHVPNMRDRYMSHPNLTQYNQSRPRERERTRRNTVYSESDHILSCFIGTARNQSY